MGSVLVGSVPPAPVWWDRSCPRVYPTPLQGRCCRIPQGGCVPGLHRGCPGWLEPLAALPLPRGARGAARGRRSMAQLQSKRGGTGGCSSSTIAEINEGLIFRAARISWISAAVTRVQAWPAPWGCHLSVTSPGVRGWGLRHPK